MIDYITVTFDHPHLPIPAGRVIAIDHDGVEEWMSVRAMQIPGSYESKMLVRSQGGVDEKGQAEQLFISGNPAKFMQGHNVFGNDDLPTLMTAAVDRIWCLLPIARIKS